MVPLTSAKDLETANATRIEAQIRHELRLLIDRHQSQTEFASALGYESQSTVSRWFGDRALGVKGATRIDAADLGPTSLGTTFEEMVLARRDAKKREAARTRTSAPAQAQAYDVFLATAMASVDPKVGYEREQSAATDLLNAIENHMRLTVYSAAATIKTRKDFEATWLAAQSNFRALISAELFVLYMSAAPLGPSGLFAEAGYALALGVPSLYLVPEPKALPYCLRALGTHKAHDVLPPVAEHQVDDLSHAIDLIRADGARIFESLRDQKRSASRKSGPK